MSGSPAPTTSVGTYTNQELAMCSASEARRFGGPILIRPDKPQAAAVTRATAAHIGGTASIDPGVWRSGVATDDRTVYLSDDDAMFAVGLDECTRSTCALMNAARALSPSLFVAEGDSAALSALVMTLQTASDPAMIRFVAASAAWLDPVSIEEFIAQFSKLPASRAVLFADIRDRPLGLKTRIQGLRTVLTECPGTSVIGIDPLIAVDALAYGAETVFLGSSSSMRFPRPPDSGRSSGFAVGGVPGTFLRDLAEMRSPEVYADWYANTRCPQCAVCDRVIDTFTSSDADKLAIVAHNFHATADWAADCAAQPVTTRRSWLHEQRVAAFLGHQDLFTQASSGRVDQTLAALVELDDPLQRIARADGTLV